MKLQRDKIRIVLQIDVIPGEGGGTAQSTQGLVRSLGELEGPEKYLLVAQTPEQAGWIAQYRGPNQEVVLRDPNRNRRPGNGTRRQSAGERFKAALRPAVKKFRRFTDRLMAPYPTTPLSDGYYESLGGHVLHFPTQSFEICALPTIYNPHDLQHLHYPQFFTPWVLAQRETVYRAACQFSRTVVVGSEFIKQDVVRQYRVHPDKVQIIPWAPPTANYPQISSAQVNETGRKLALPSSYALYPAVAWAHKNHLRLFDALAELRDRRGLVVNLICTGARDQDHWPQIEQRITELNLASQVRFLGFLSEVDLRAVYRLAEFLVFPSLYEADSCPIHEAWCEGLPVAAANLSGLPDQVGDAGLLFDATDVSAIADALQKMSLDSHFRAELVQRGYRRVKDFSWERTAKAFRAVYRSTAGVTLSDEDRRLLAWDWMREPRRTALPQETHA